MKICIEIRLELCKKEMKISVNDLKVSILSPGNQGENDTSFKYLSQKLTIG